MTGNPPGRPPRVGDPDGFGRYGIIDTDDDGRLLCHECGAYWGHLATHARLAHGITAPDYRRQHGLGSTTKLAGAGARRKMREAFAARTDDPLGTLEAHRDPGTAADRSLSHRGGAWAPEVRAKRAALARARRGRELTPQEVGRLAAVGHDLQAWADTARSILADPTVSTTSIAAVSDITPSTVSQRLRRYPAR